MKEKYYLLVPKFYSKDILFNLFKINEKGRLKTILQSTCHLSSSLVSYTGTNKCSVNRDFFDSYTLKKIKKNVAEDIIYLNKNYLINNNRQRLESVINGYK